MYVDFTAHGVTDSLGMCGALLEEAGVAMTPGVDFEDEGSGLGQLALAPTRTLNPNPNPSPSPSPSPNPTTNPYPYPVTRRAAGAHLLPGLDGARGRGDAPPAALVAERAGAALALVTGRGRSWRALLVVRGLFLAISTY